MKLCGSVCKALLKVFTGHVSLFVIGCFCVGIQGLHKYLSQQFHDLTCFTSGKVCRKCEAVCPRPGFARQSVDMWKGQAEANRALRRTMQLLQGHPPSLWLADWSLFTTPLRYLGFKSHIWSYSCLILQNF